MSSIKNYLRTSNEILTLKDDSGFVEYRKVVPNDQKIRGSLYILPPTGGENIIDRMYAQDLAVLGFEVFIMRNWTGLSIDGVAYDLHNVFYGQTQDALDKIIALASTSKIGILGTSVGALHTSVALTINPKVKTGFMIVGGLSIPEDIVYSSQPAMVKLKEKRYTEYDLKDDQQYLQELSAVFKLDPLQQTVNHAKGKKVGFVLSTNDTLVPTVNQEKSAQFFEASPKYVSPLNHVQTVMWYGFFKRHLVTDFFNKNL